MKITPTSKTEKTVTNFKFTIGAITAGIIEDLKRRSSGILQIRLLKLPPKKQQTKNKKGEYTYESQ